jgi:hypothetical protein
VSDREIYCMNLWRSWLSFNCFSFDTCMQGVHRMSLGLNQREDQIELEKLRLGERCAQCQGANEIHRVNAKEC